MRGSEPDWRIVAVLGLADEVPGDDVRVGGLVGEDQAVGRAGEHVDADATEQDALGLGDELVAGADQDVGLRQAEQAERHRRHALHAAEGEDLVGAAEVGRIDDGGRDADAGARRRACGDVAAARDLGGRHRHQRRGDVAVAPARRVAPGRLARDRLLPRHHSRADLDLHVLDRRLLRLGETADIVPGEADVVLQLLRHGDGSGGDLVAGQHHVAVVAVELRGISHRRFVAAGLDLVEDRLDGRPHVACIVGGLSRGLLEVFDGHGSLTCRCREAAGWKAPARRRSAAQPAA